MIRISGKTKEIKRSRKCFEMTEDQTQNQTQKTKNKVPHNILLAIEFIH
jgi:hypothetical protein